MRKRNIIIIFLLIILATLGVTVFSYYSKNEKKMNKLNNEGTKQTSENNKSPKGTFQTYEELPFELFCDLDYLKVSVNITGSFAREKTGWYRKENNLLIVFDKYLIGTSDNIYNIDYKIKANEVLENMKEQFLNTATSKLSFSDTYELNIRNKEDVLINGWDMCKYTGYVQLDPNKASVTYKDKQANFIAYGVIKDSYPVYFVVFDITDEQDQQSQIADLAEKIAHTFREPQ